MKDNRDARIAIEHLDHAAWECYEAGVTKERALKIIADCYNDNEAEKEADHGA